MRHFFTPLIYFSYDLQKSSFVILFKNVNQVQVDHISWISNKEFTGFFNSYCLFVAKLEIEYLFCLGKCLNKNNVLFSKPPTNLCGFLKKCYSRKKPTPHYTALGASSRLFVSVGLEIVTHRVFLAVR